MRKSLVLKEKSGHGLATETLLLSPYLFNPTQRRTHLRKSISTAEFLLRHAKNEKSASPLGRDLDGLWRSRYRGRTRFSVG